MVPDGCMRSGTPATHAAHEAARLEHALVVGAGVRAALIEVVQQARRRPAPAERPVERLERQMPVIDGTHGQPTTNREDRSRIAAR
jgi:hypothetical protein